MDRLEAEEAEAAAAFAEGRKKKAGSTAAAKKKAPAKTADDNKADKALLKRPLQECGSLEGVEKQTWGSGATKTRKFAEPEAGVRGEEVPAAAPKTRKRTAGGSDAPESTPAPKEEGGASLLSRLLNKTSDAAPSLPSYQPLGFGSSLSSFSTLSSSEDVFGYLKSSGGRADDGATSNAVDTPAAAHKVTSQDAPADAGGGRGKGRGKGRGRGRTNKVDDDEDAAEDIGVNPAKRRKSSE